MARLLRNASSLRGCLFSQLQGERRGSLETSTQLCYFATKGRRKSKADASDSGEENMSKKDLALKLALDQITSSFGQGSIMWLGRSESYRHTPVVSTGSFTLDMALGIGGLPKGRVVEIYGPEASGKTTLALHVIAESQKQGGYCVFVDAEHALDPTLAEAIGVDTKNLLLSQPDSGEQALSLVDTLIRSGSVDVVVVDSVAALVPKGELDGEMGDAHMAMQARLMINEVVRAKLSITGFGGPTEVTCGGNALKFYASVRLNIRRIGMVKRGEETIGSQVAVKIVKNKHAPPFRTAQFELEFGKGISREAELIELGSKYNLITKTGMAHYNINDQVIYGKDAFKRYLSENVSVRDELMANLRQKITDGEQDSEKFVEDVPASETTDEEAIAAAEA
ncbi:hypothetical protein SASPL_129332 [Salvia splendens]|uniref:Recombination protein RecA n=1 Tax=Salvia splendens TaxID=180675 RepID=A0A8X8ZPC3_SALSN|nr:hypothetical protein SASPL_129332 [Salvia splendens]